MPLPIIDDNTEKAAAGRGIKRNEIEQLKNMYKFHTGKKKNPAGPFNPHNPQDDSTSAWFPLQEVLDFMISNGVQIQYSNVGDLGLRIYFGMHHQSNDFQPVPALPTTPVHKYYFKDAPILVVTKKNEEDPGKQDDLLNSGNYVTIAGGEGFDNARLCPPECNGGM